MFTERKLFFHVAGGFDTVNRLIGDYYPEFTDSLQIEALVGASIRVINEHNGHVHRFDNDLPLFPGTWIILPYLEPGCSVLHQLSSSSSNPHFTGVIARSAYIKNIPHNLDRKTIDLINKSVREIGPMNSIAAMNVTGEFLEGIRDRLLESPVKDLANETSQYMVAEAGKHMGKINAVVRNYDRALKSFAAIEGKGGAIQIAKKAATQEVLKAHKEVTEHLPKVAKEYVQKIIADPANMPAALRGPRALMNPKHAMKSALIKKSFVITESEYTKFIKYMKYGEYIERGFIGLNIVLAADDVYDAYKEGKDWKETAVEKTMGITIGLIGSALCVGGGPIGVIGCGVIGDKIGEQIGKIIYERAKQNYKIIFEEHR